MLIYNAGYLEGRDLPPEKELLEYIPVEMFDTAQHIASRGPFLVAKEVLPAMRKKGEGSFFFSNNSSSLRGRKRMTGQSLYYPRVMMRTLAQVLTEEYSEHGVHVANVVIDGTIDSPGTRALPRNAEPARSDHQSGEDRRGVLVSAHAGPVMLDARTPADAVPDQAELLTAEPFLIFLSRRRSEGAAARRFAYRSARSPHTAPRTPLGVPIGRFSISRGNPGGRCGGVAAPRASRCRAGPLRSRQP